MDSTVLKTFLWLKSTLLTSRKGVRDVVILMVPQAVALVTGFLTSIIIARGLGPGGLGQYALVMSVAGIALSLSDLGIGQTAIRYASRAVSVGDTDGQFAFLRWAFRMRLGLAFAVTALFYLLSPSIAQLWNKPEITELLRIGLMAGIFSALAAVPGVYFQSIKRFEKNATVVVTQTLITFLGILIIAWLELWSVERVLIATLVGTAVGTLIFLFMIPGRALFPARRLHWNEVRFRRLFGKPPLLSAKMQQEGDVDASTFVRFNLISSVVVMIILRADVWLMGFFLHDSDIGIYAAASRFAIPLSVVHGAIAAALWPRASAHLPREETVAMLRQTLRLAAVVAAAGAIYAIAFPLLTPVFFGSAFRASALIAQLLSLRYALAILIVPVSVIGYSFGMVQVYWWINLLQLAIVVIVNVFLLPVLGPLGAACALIISEAFGGTMAVTQLRSRIRHLRLKGTGQ